MSARTKENWLAVIAKEGSCAALSRFIIADLTGYRSSSQWKEDDMRSVENMLIAFQRYVEAKTALPIIKESVQCNP